MQPLSSANIANILALIDCDHSACQIASITGFHASTITRVWSKHHAHIPKSSGGRPSKLSPTNIYHAVHLINTGKADNATQVTQSLQSITNQSLSTQTIHCHLKRAGLKAVVKRRSALCSPSATGMSALILPWAIGTGRLMTGCRWCGQMRSKLIAWGQMGENGCGKVLERVSLIT